MFSTVGLNFDRVSPRTYLTNVVYYVVVIPIVPVETLIGVSPVVHPYTFGLVGVSPVTLPYTPISIFCTRMRQKTPTQKIFLSMHVYSTIPSTVQYLTIK